MHRDVCLFYFLGFLVSWTRTYAFTAAGAIADDVHTYTSDGKRVITCRYEDVRVRKYPYIHSTADSRALFFRSEFASRPAGGASALPRGASEPDPAPLP
ncbi:hypothetical protein K505DRAFT_92867 [Melanomma pulvis-pyrius CBS 109.77]|uniref:Secreted protein n=1 Tax=Melanomma pulvis-pyrius CBS 109.77 TaxID=1314802 RepID=A0A6A6WZI2_9PLEO|nr:hypothetical protein K505DRAFT_92867 [Melanomma pulvis-pyrius CBS 109.77]